MHQTFSIEGLEEKLGVGISPLEIANALYLYCGWMQEDKSGEFNIDGANLKQISRVIITLERKRAEVRREENGNYILVMHENFPDGCEGFGGFERYLEEYLRMPVKSRQEVWSALYSIKNK